MNDYYILGTKVNDLSMNEVINKIEQFLKTGQKGFIITPNPEICLLAYKFKPLRYFINDSFISIPDGFGLKIGSLIIYGKWLKNITPGSDLCQQIFKLAEQKKYSVLFFEGQPKIGEKALKNIKQKYPKLAINFIDLGKIELDGTPAKKDYLTKINNYQPDIVLVNFGAPKQENFIKNNLENLNTKLMIGVGGSLDFISGRIKRAPQIWRKIGLEWLWRLFQEPWRWKRIFNAVIIFPLACLRFKFGLLFSYRKNVVACIVNDQNQILITKHAKNQYWQFPQGGAKNARSYEDYKNAVLREMEDELGTNKFEVLDFAKNCHQYTWPKSNNPRKHFDHFKGQKQSLFLLKFTGNDQDINLDPKEHSAWQWTSKEKINDLFPEFKKPIINTALNKFQKYV